MAAETKKADSKPQPDIEHVCPFCGSGLFKGPQRQSRILNGVPVEVDAQYKCLGCGQQLKIDDMRKQPVI